MLLLVPRPNFKSRCSMGIRKRTRGLDPGAHHSSPKQKIMEDRSREIPETTCSRSASFMLPVNLNLIISVPLTSCLQPGSEGLEQGARAFPKQRSGECWVSAEGHQGSAV